MALRPRFAEGLVETEFKFAGQHVQSGSVLSSGFLECAQQRMLMLTRIMSDLRYFGLGDLVGKDPAVALAARMHLEHHARRRVAGHREEAFEHVYHEFHWRLIVIQDDEAEQPRDLSLRYPFRHRQAPVTSLFPH